MYSRLFVDNHRCRLVSAFDGICLEWKISGTKTRTKQTSQKSLPRKRKANHRIRHETYRYIVYSYLNANIQSFLIGQFNLKIHQTYLLMSKSMISGFGNIFPTESTYPAINFLTVFS